MSVYAKVLLFLIDKSKAILVSVRFPVQKRDGGIETAVLLIYTLAIVYLRGTGNQ